MSGSELAAGGKAAGTARTTGAGAPGPAGAGQALGGKYYTSTRFQRNYKTALARAYVRVVGVNREPIILFFELVLPLLAVAAYVFVYLAAIPDSVSNAQFLRDSLALRVIIGGAMMAFWLNMLWGMASQFHWERESGNLEIFLAAPISRMSVLAGMAIGGMFNNTLRAFSTILLGTFIFAITFSVSNPFMLIAVFIFTLLALYGMGMMFASLFLLYGREAWHTANLMHEPIFLVSGFYFPIKFLPYYVVIFSGIIPMTLGLDAMNQIMGGNMAVNWGLLPVHIELALLLLLTGIFLFLAKACLDYMERVAKREARLALRQQ